MASSSDAILFARLETNDARPAGGCFLMDLHQHTRELHYNIPFVCVPVCRLRVCSLCSLCVFCFCKCVRSLWVCVYFVCVCAYFIYVCSCFFVCVCAFSNGFASPHSRIALLQYTPLSVCIYVCVLCVCVRALCMCAYQGCLQGYLIGGGKSKFDQFASVDVEV